MKTLRRLVTMRQRQLYFAVILAASLTLVSGAVITGVCENDVQCIAGGTRDSCCSRWSPLGAVYVCKTMGKRGEPCHVKAEELPYPLDGKHRFWHCPCTDGLMCVSGDGARVGLCM
ncbi:PREDICTED: prokineticin Bo8-like [Branchiostoma belcheri]|uniref:Prokineticin Bo8-like n=1 Tax=Branchiostoma belcheri TaxID=7741 RepID=A0A6P4YEJ1_BRABE|nr:PREDICTED: prokineticin Bo8-like [Branchiostoma belcheri]